MFRKFCSSAVYSPTPHVLILTALTCGYNQQVITWRNVQFFTRTTRLYLRFPLSLPWNKNDSNNSPPHGPKGQACPMGFQGVDAEEGGWWQVNWTMHPHDSFLLGDKETTAFHSDYSFFWAGIWREWVQVHEWHPRGRRKKTFHPFVLITLGSLFLDLYSSSSNACHTDISIWEYMCFEYPILVLKSLLLVGKPKH